MRLSVTQLDLRGKRVFLLAQCAGLTVSGVGDTVAPLRRPSVAEKLDYLSPSGAAPSSKPSKAAACPARRRCKRRS